MSDEEMAEHAHDDSGVYARKNETRWKLFALSLASLLALIGLVAFDGCA